MHEGWANFQLLSLLWLGKCRVRNSPFVLVKLNDKRLPLSDSIIFYMYGQFLLFHLFHHCHCHSNCMSWERSNPSGGEGGGSRERGAWYWREGWWWSGTGLAVREERCGGSRLLRAAFLNDLCRNRPCLRLYCIFFCPFKVKYAGFKPWFTMLHAFVILVAFWWFNAHGYVITVGVINATITSKLWCHAIIILMVTQDVFNS